MNNTKKYLLTGITPSGELTIANYIGAIKNLLNIQKLGYSSIIFIADMHAITNNVNVIDVKELKEKSFNIACFYKACDLDKNDNIIFLQSDVNYHTELGYILMCHTNLGELERMTQFKDKSIKNQNKTQSIPSGLLFYPILMAADIILYKPHIIPVGQDQKQHIELTTNLIKKMKKYGINIPDIQINMPKTGAKITSLLKPDKKMSKSDDNPKSYVSLLDSCDEVRKKIMSAVTDSDGKIIFDPKNKPGISNLLNIYSEITNISIKELENKYKNQNYTQFKKDLGEKINEFLKPIQEKYYYYQKHPEIIKKMLSDGAIKANNIAKNNIKEFKNKLFFQTNN